MDWNHLEVERIRIEKELEEQRMKLASVIESLGETEEVEEEIELGEGVITAKDAELHLTVGTKIRVLTLSIRDGWKTHERDIIGEEFSYGGKYLSSSSYNVLIPVGPVTNTVMKSAMSAPPHGLCIKDAPETLFEIIDHETEENMATKSKIRISPVTGKPVRTYRRKVGTTTVVEETPKNPWNTKGTPFVTLNDYFKLPRGVYNVLRRNIERGTNTLLLGPTGVGKTELVSNIAKEMGLPLTIFDMGTMSDPIMSLVGNHVIKVEDGKTSSEFVKSRFSKAIQEPGIILLDELSRASATANNLLFPCLDFRKELAMEYSFEDNTPIKVHPQCIFVATANLGSQYTGTHKLDRALLDRFMLVEIDPLGTDQIKQAIKFHCPKLSEIEVNKLVNVYNSINKAHDDYTISFNMSLRHLKMISELVSDGFTIYDSFYVVCKGIGSKDGLKSIESILNTAK